MSFLAMIDSSPKDTCCNRFLSIVWEFGDFLMLKHGGYEISSDNEETTGKAKMEEEEEELYIDDTELYTSYVASLKKENSTKPVYNLRPRKSVQG